MTPKRENVEITRLKRELAIAQAETEIARTEQYVLKAAMESLGKAHALLETLAESAAITEQPEPSKKPPSWTSSETD